MQRYTIRDLELDFPTEEACMEWLVKFLYPEGIYCQTCQAVTNHYRVKSRTSYSCQFCGHHEHPMAGTIFQDTRTPLRSWFHAIFLMASTRCGISAKQLEREIGVTYKTAWRMFTQIRKLLSEDEGWMLSGTVEVDETFIGGKPRYARGQRPLRADGSMVRGRRPASHAKQNDIVAGAVERGGRVVAKVVPDRTKATLIPLATTHILPSSTIYTDELYAYNGLSGRGYHHRRIRHAAHIYVKGDVHTNTIEGFWSLLKRSLAGAHHAVSAKYLQSYLDEWTFRYNHRRDDAPMFLSMLAQIEKYGG